MESIDTSLLISDPLFLETHHLDRQASPSIAFESNRFVESYPLDMSQRASTTSLAVGQSIGLEQSDSVAFDASRNNPRSLVRQPQLITPNRSVVLDHRIAHSDELIAPDGMFDQPLVGVSELGDRRTKKPQQTSFNRLVIKDRGQRVVGTGQADRIDASKGRGQNQLLGKGGNDRIFVSKKDTAKGAGGSDYLSAEKGKARNRLKGGRGNDTLVARKRDRLFGESGHDILDSRNSKANNQLHGGSGNDRLYAGRKRDALTGGRGSDQFWLATQQLPLIPHTVHDFEPGIDRLGIDRVDGITGVTDLTIAATALGTMVSAQGEAIALLRNVVPQQLGSENFIVVSDSNSPAPTRDISNDIFATYRKDFFFSNEIYDEDTPEPLTGGRVQIAAIAQATGRVNNVFIDGIERRVIYEKNPSETPPFEWVHVWPPRATQGEPIWVNFHSVDPKWDTLTQAPIRVETRNGPAIDGTFAVNQTPVPLTYVTTTDDYSRMLIHAQNTDNVTHRVKHLWVNGRDVLTDAAISSNDRRDLAADSHMLWEVALTEPTAPGEAWTVVVEYDDAPAAVGTGRIVPELFPVMAWNNTSERPFPSGNNDNYLNIRDAGIDTIFVNGGTCRGNACDPYQLINEELAELDEFGAFVTYAPFIDPNANFPELTDTSGIVAVMTGDESDDTLYDDDTGIPIPALKAQDSRRSWLRYPELPTFNGGKTNKLIGSFAGMTDIQGIDFYTAAGAPHITAFGEHPPLRATFDYLRNTRNNHMPLTTWMYTQGLSPVWNRDPLFGGDEITVQPDPQEILAQGMMAIAAGAKGLAWFQVNQQEARKAPERWQAIADLNRMVGAVRPWLREGDVTGSAASDEDTLVEMIQAPDALIVPIVSMDTATEPTDIGFILAQSEDTIPRWTFNDSTPDISITIPPDFKVTDVFEVQPDGISDITVNISNQTALFEDVELTNDMPIRLLVLASDSTIRSDIQRIL
ncbi:MAG: calcium-binding protein [Cyanobacteria bacterium P01_E01_bin.6]